MAALKTLGFVAFLATMFLATVAATFVGNGNPAIALAPIAGAAVFYLMWKLPGRYSAMALMFLMLVVDYIQERPFAGLWESPLYPLGRLLTVNLNTLTGVGFLRFPILDFLLMALTGILIFRRVKQKRTDHAVAPVARPLPVALALSLVTLVWLEGWGVANGGNFKESLWQIRASLFLPIVAFIFMSSLRGAEDLRSLAYLIIAAACIKAVLAIYFIFRIARPGGHYPEYATCHSDTLLFVCALMIGTTLFLEQPTRKNLARGLTYMPLVTVGMILNDRRIAYVTLAFALVMVFALSPWTAIKRWVTRAVILATPVAILYFAAGWDVESQSKLWAPVRFVKGLVERQEEIEGPDYRDMENYNLLVTWAKSPLLGSGFGMTFIEEIRLPDISKAMPNYQYQPHNCVLWLWGIGGVLGVSGLWLYIAVTAFLAARTYHRARQPEIRSACLVALTMLIAYLNQCFGDMGTLNYFGAFFVALSAAVVGKLAIQVGAYPAPARQTVAERSPALAAPYPAQSRTT